MAIENLDGSNSGPAVLDAWELAGCYIQNVNYGENNYATSDALTITIAIKYDNANHVILGTEALAGGLGNSTEQTSGGVSPT